jgi:hypothetical protein
MVDALNLDFDWLNGEIDLAVKTGVWVNPEKLVSELSRVTGIKTHDE